MNKVEHFASACVVLLLSTYVLRRFWEFLHVAFTRWSYLLGISIKLLPGCAPQLARAQHVPDSSLLVPSAGSVLPTFWAAFSMLFVASLIYFLKLRGTIGFLSCPMVPRGPTFAPLDAAM